MNEIDLSVDLASPEVQKMFDRPLLPSGKLDVIIHSVELTNAQSGAKMLVLIHTPAAPTVRTVDGEDVSSERVKLYNRILLEPSGGMTLDRVVANVANLVKAARLTSARLNAPETWIHQLNGKKVTAVVRLEDERKSDDGREFPKSNSIRRYEV